MFGITKSHHSQSLEVENGSRKLSNLKAVNSESICFCEFWFCFRENVLRKIHTNSLTPTYTHNTLTATHTAQHVHTHTHTQSQAHTNTHTTITHTQKKPNMYTHTHTSSTHTHTHQAHTHTHQAHTHTHSQAPTTNTHRTKHTDTLRKYPHCSRGSTKCGWSGSVWDPHRCPKTAEQSQHGSEQALWTWRHTALLAERRSRLKILLGWSVYQLTK